MDDDARPSRRALLGFGTVALGTAPIAAGLVTALRAGLAADHLEHPGAIPLCRLSEIPSTGLIRRAIAVDARRGPQVDTIARVVFLTRDDAGQPIAMSGECTHLACPVQLRNVELEPAAANAPLACPCHGGRFSRTGEVLDGPPPAPLRRLRIEVPAEPDGVVNLLEL
jgi:Rieske Fe-S protein